MTIAEMLERQASTKVRRWMLNGENLKIKLVENYKFIVITFGIISSLFLISDIKFLAIIFWVLTLISYLVGWPLNQALQQNSDMKRDG